MTPNEQQYPAKTGYGQVANNFVISAQAMSLFLPASRRVSSAPCKLLKKLSMDKERSQTQVAESITPLVSPT
jgi:hypothetical protein